MLLIQYNYLSNNSMFMTFFFKFLVVLRFLIQFYSRPMKIHIPSLSNSYITFYCKDCHGFLEQVALFLPSSPN